MRNTIVLFMLKLVIKKKLHQKSPVVSPQVDTEVFAVLELERNEGRVVLNKDLIQKATGLLSILVCNVLLLLQCGLVNGRRGGM